MGTIFILILHLKELRHKVYEQGTNRLFAQVTMYETRKHSVIA